ncbi:MAG: M48 family metallopeptidase [Verrucomicrobia bacterium]|nr:M48 family metallopeptidase [Verrucomicrobiota bacterium]
MNFFRAQDEARGRTTKLVVLLVLAILVLTGGLYAIAVYGKGVYMGRGRLDWLQPKLFLATSGTALAVILGGSWLRISELAKGGAFIAQSLGGRPVSAHTKDPAERRYLNIVEEMALASGLPVPACFVVDGDTTINAFAAGNNPQDAAVAVTRGALTYLNRDELQGVIAHEFSHIGNGDMKLNLRIIGTIAGLTALSQLGYILMRLMRHADSKDSAKVGVPLAIGGLVIFLLGLGGVLFARIIQASVSRQREYLADASAVQFTRNPEGLAGALKKIAGLKGGQREASTSELETQHLFFSSTGGFMEFIFSSHPPIGDRIRRLLPTFDGVIPDVEPVAASDELVAGLSGRQSATAIPPPIRAARAHRIPTNLEIQDAVGFQGTLPMELRASAADSIGAMAIVLGLILRQNPELRAQQLQTARGLAGGEVIAEALRLAPLLQALPAGSRLPLLDLSMPALRQLSKAQLALFRLAIQKVGFDANDGLIVLLVQASMRRYLDDVGRSGPPPMLGVSASYALVLSAVVRTSRETAQAQQEAFALGVAELARPDLATTILPESEVDLQKVDEALAVIAVQSVFERRRFVRACGVAMLHDDVAEAAEIEILRTVADTLGITFATGLRAA